MTANEADPITLTPDPRADRYLRIELYAHLEVALQLGLRDGKGMRGRGGTALEPIDHGFKIPFLWSLGWSVLRWRSVDCLMEDGIVRVMLFHCVEIVGTFK